MVLSGLAEVLIDSEIFNNSDPDISNICYDSRKCTAGSLFVAVRGTISDGHEYIAKAVENGACCVLVEELPENYEQYSDVAFILTSDTRKALADLAHKYYDNPSQGMKMIAVTGTNGKTTITFLLRSLFNSLGMKTGIIGTTGIFSGDRQVPATHTTPESLELSAHLSEMKKDGIDIVIMEVSSHALCQQRIRGIQFDAAVFTNLTREHLDYHNSMEEYAAAKKILFDNLSLEACAVVNADSDYSEFMLKDCVAQRIKKVGRKPEADIVISEEVLKANKSDYTLQCGGKKEKFTHMLTGKFNIDNAVQSLAVCSMISGKSIFDLKSAISHAEAAPGRMQRVVLKSGAVGIVDYAHTPDALEKALMACREITDSVPDTEAKLYCVFGCGGDRDAGKRPIMGELAGRIADYAVITNDNPRTEDPDRIIEQIYDGISRKEKSKTVMISDRREALDYVCKFAVENDIILVAGKGHENYQIVGTEKQHFDDAEELIKHS